MPRTSPARCAARRAPGFTAEPTPTDPTHRMDKTLLAVNGTLMRGLELNPNMIAAGATFVREDETEACYRIWSIGDRHPAMQRMSSGAGGGARVALELWDVPLAGL